MNLLLEVRKKQGDDWELLKTSKYTNRNVISYKKQAKRLIKKCNSQVHICGWADINDDPSFQEFYYSDGTKTKMF